MQSLICKVNNENKNTFEELSYVLEFMSFRYILNNNALYIIN